MTAPRTKSKSIKPSDAPVHADSDLTEKELYRAIILTKALSNGHPLTNRELRDVKFALRRLGHDPRIEGLTPPAFLRIGRLLTAEFPSAKAARLTTPLPSFAEAVRDGAW